MDLLDMRFERQPTIVTRRVAGEIILIPITRRMGEEAALYTLDEVAAFLWERLHCGQTGRALVAALKSSYNVDRAQAEEDVRVYLEQLRAIEAVRPVEQREASTEGPER